VHGWQTPPENRVPAPGTGGSIIRSELRITRRASRHFERSAHPDFMAGKFLTGHDEPAREAAGRGWDAFCVLRKGERSGVAHTQPQSRPSDLWNTPPELCTLRYKGAVAHFR
jgi:hypothetical protein